MKLLFIFLRITSKTKYKEYNKQNIHTNKLIFKQLKKLTVMKTIEIEGMKLIKLKPEKSNYCGKSIKRDRYISEDRKFYITFGLCESYHYYDEHTKVFIGNENHKAVLLNKLYHKGSYHAYPIYSINSAIKKIKELNINPEFVIEIDQSHFA